MNESPYGHPEPVPAASQLTALPFLAAVDGFLRADGDVPGLRITLHRTTLRGRDQYLQQVCPYFEQGKVGSRSKVGRIFPVGEGIMGAAYGSRRIWRTKPFEDLDALRVAFAEDEPGKNVEELAHSWLAVPFLGAGEEVVLVLFADCRKLNFFRDDSLVLRVVAMTQGFCSLLDQLQQDPFSNLRNFPVQQGVPVEGGAPVYKIQESLPHIAPPRFEHVPSFNYEAAAA